MATATPDIDHEPDGDAEPPFEIEPSELDEQTHAEALSLYRDAEDNIRFAKLLQWRTTFGTLLIFALLVAAGRLTGRDEAFAKICVIVSLAVSACSIYSIAILQSWQNTEREKVETVVKQLSNLFDRVYGLKSRIEANIHRYILVAFMAIAILIANYLAASLLMHLYRP